MDKILNEIAKRIIEELLFLEITTGRILMNEQNLKSVYKLDDIIEKVLKESGYYDELKKYKSEFNTITKDNLGDYKSSSSDALKAYNEQAYNKFYNTFANDFPNSEIKVPLKDLVLSTIATSGTYKELQKGIKELLNSGKIAGRLAVLSDEVYTVFKREQGMILATEKGVQYFRYVGGKIDTTREFCRKRYDRIFSLEEIRSWSSLDWGGKNPKTNSSNITSYLGGYLCRHVLQPVTEATAKREGYNIYNE